MTKERVQKAIKEFVYGVWTPEHTENEHYYRHNPTGTLVASVTSKLILEKVHLRNWAVRVGIEWLEQDDRWNKYLEHKQYKKNEYLQGAILAHTDIRDDAGSVGSAVHQAAEDFINEWIATGVKPEDILKFIPEHSRDDGRVVAGARSVKRLFDDRPKVIPVASELLVGSLRLGTAGTLDLLVLNDGVLELFDFKTSNSIDPINYSMQVAAYSHMFTAMTKLRPVAWRVIKISKDYDRVDIYKLTGYSNAVRCFEYLAKVYELTKGGYFTLERDVPRIVL